MRRIEALFWLLGTRTTAFNFRRSVFLWWGPKSRRPKEVLKRMEGKCAKTEQPDHCSQLVWFDAQMVPFYHAREEWSRKNVTFCLRRAERFSSPSSLFPRYIWPLYPLAWPCLEPDSWPLYHVGVSWLSLYEIDDRAPSFLTASTWHRAVACCASLPRWTFFCFFVILKGECPLYPLGQIIWEWRG